MGARLRSLANKSSPCRRSLDLPGRSGVRAAHNQQRTEEIAGREKHEIVGRRSFRHPVNLGENQAVRKEDGVVEERLVIINDAPRIDRFG
jgi:hypothetical protein